MNVNNRDHTVCNVTIYVYFGRIIYPTSQKLRQAVNNKETVLKSSKKTDYVLLVYLQRDPSEMEVPDQYQIPLILSAH